MEAAQRWKDTEKQGQTSANWSCNASLEKPTPADFVVRFHQFVLNAVSQFVDAMARKFGNECVDFWNVQVDKIEAALPAICRRAGR